MRLRLFPFVHFIFKEELVFQFVEEELLHHFYLLSGFFVLLHPLSLFLVIDIPLAVSGLVECLFEQIFDSGLKDGERVFVFVLNDLVVGILAFRTILLLLLQILLE